MSINSLLSAIDKIELETSTKEWFDSLDDRKKEEAEFHDFSHDEDTALENKKFYTTTKVSTDYITNWLIDNTKDKVFLDYACGNGKHNVLVAKNGAKYSIGIDISPVSVENARKLAAKNNVVDNTRFFVGDCENTGMPDNCIDVVLCAGVLHHMDLNNVYPELKRIMKPGGKLLAVEALNYNPIIRMYRMRTPEMRTEWEKHHILDLEDVRLGQKYFELTSIKFWHMFSFLSAFLRKIPVLFSLSLGLFNFMDSVFTKIPLVRRMAWQFTFVFENNKQ